MIQIPNIEISDDTDKQIIHEIKIRQFIRFKVIHLSYNIIYFALYSTELIYFLFKKQKIE